MSTPTADPRARIAPLAHRSAPLVHAPWTTKWWASDADLAALFGAHATARSLREAADAVDARWGRNPGSASTSSRAATGLGSLPADPLIVLAGQQPILAGGPLLVAHKAATAVALARQLAEAWNRPVVPVFLLADEDHDTSESDHADIIDPSTGSLLRIRCQLQPENEAFYRSAWDAATLCDSIRRTAQVSGDVDSQLRSIACLPEAGPSVSAHVGRLLLASFGHLGLVTLSAHDLSLLHPELIEDALAHPDALAKELAAGATRLVSVGLRPTFDPGDPRPLVMESRGGRRRRVAAGDGAALARLRQSPDDFSPQAALRPVIQAAGLPVVAQVCGPSELLYLGQMRGMHRRHGLCPPVLVPRMEATRLTPEDLALLGGDLERIDLASMTAAPGLPLKEELQLLEAARAFVQQVIRHDASLAARAARWLAGLERSSHRLAEAPAWRGRGGGHALQRQRPRGRWQDTVLAWLPDAWRDGNPRAWGDRIVELCRPLDAPAHVLHVLPEAAPPAGSRSDRHG